MGDVPPLWPRRACRIRGVGPARPAGPGRARGVRAASARRRGSGRRRPACAEPPLAVLITLMVPAVPAVLAMSITSRVRIRSVPAVPALRGRPCPRHLTAPVRQPRPVPGERPRPSHGDLGRGRLERVTRSVCGARGVNRARARHPGTVIGPLVVLHLRYPRDRRYRTREGMPGRQGSASGLG